MREKDRDQGLILAIKKGPEACFGACKLADTHVVLILF